MKNSYLQILFISALFSFWNIAVSAQDAMLAVSGSIKNSVTNEPLQAKVTFIMMPDGNNIFITNGEKTAGNYKLELLRSAQYRVEVQSEGFKPLSCTITGIQLDSAKYRWDFLLEPAVKTQVRRLENLIFPQSRADIPASAYPELDELANWLIKNPKMIVQLEGHTDFRGDSKSNVKLSKKRVEAVKKYMVNKGVSGKRIKIKAFGGSSPLSKENTEEAAKANRRVEVRILQGN
jgi:OmpA-OmpF porin, OOP family